MTSIKHGRFNQPSIAIALCLTSMTLFSMQDAVVKWLSADYWLIQLLFIRSLVVVIGSGSFIALTQGKQGFVTHRKRDHLLRTFFNFFAFVSYYMAVTMMPLANATSIALTAPLFMTALSGPLLGEPVGWRRYLILLFGFVGVLIVIQPNAADLNLQGSLYALAGAFLFAMLAIQNRKMSKDESSEIMVFYAAVVFLIVTAVMMIFYWQAVGAESLALMFLLGIITLFAQYTITLSFQYAQVHVIAPFEYITIVWAVLIGWLLFSEIPELSMISGAILIILAGLALVWYERIEHRRNSQAIITPP